MAESLVRIAKPRHDSDCVAASLATILELPIDDVPDFWESAKKGANAQYEHVSKWLSERGFHYYYADCHARQFAEFQGGKWEKGNSWPPKGYWLGRISRVDSIIDNEPGHMVVMKGRRCVYNPSGSIKSTKDNDVFLIGYYLLVPLDPSRSQKP